MQTFDERPEVFGRRRTLKLLGAGIVAGGLLVVEGCSKDSAPSADLPPPSPKPATPAAAQAGSGAMDCNAAIDDASRALRRTTQYKDKAAVPEKHCSACAQYQAGKYGDCGGCKLFTGPVQPNGGCLSFAPIGAEAGPGAPAPAKGT